MTRTLKSMLSKLQESGDKPGETQVTLPVSPLEIEARADGDSGLETDELSAIRNAADLAREAERLLERLRNAGY